MITSFLALMSRREKRMELELYSVWTRSRSLRLRDLVEGVRVQGLALKKDRRVGMIESRGRED